MRKRKEFLPTKASDFKARSSRPPIVSGIRTMPIAPPTPYTRANVMPMEPGTGIPTRMWGEPDFPPVGVADVPLADMLPYGGVIPNAEPLFPTGPITNIGNEQADYPTVPGMPAYPNRPPIRPMPQRQDVFRNENLFPLLGAAGLLSAFGGGELFGPVLSAGAQGLMAGEESRHQREFEEWQNLSAQERQTYADSVAEVDRNFKHQMDLYDAGFKMAQDKQIRINQRRDDERAQAELARKKRELGNRIYTSVSRITDPVQQEAAWKRMQEDWGPELLAEYGIGPAYDANGNYIPIYDVQAYKSMKDAENKGDRLAFDKAKESNRLDEKQIDRVFKLQLEEIKGERMADLQDKRLTAQATQAALNRASSETINLRNNSAKLNSAGGKLVGGVPAAARSIMDKMSSLALSKQKYIAEATKPNPYTQISGTANQALIDEYDRQMQQHVQNLNDVLAPYGLKWDGNAEKGQIKTRSSGPSGSIPGNTSVERLQSIRVQPTGNVTGLSPAVVRAVGPTLPFAPTSGAAAPPRLKQPGKTTIRETVPAGKTSAQGGKTVTNIGKSLAPWEAEEKVRAEKKPPKGKEGFRNVGPGIWVKVKS